MKNATIFKLVSAWLMANWVSVPVALQILVIMNFVEILTGLFNPKVHIVEQIKRIVVSLILSVTAHFVYGIAKIQTGLNLGFDLASVVSIFYIISSTIFVLKNCDSVPGLALPPVLLDMLSKAEGITGSEKKDILALQLKQQNGQTTLDIQVSDPVDSKKGDKADGN